MRIRATDVVGEYCAFDYYPKYHLKAETFWSAKVPGTRSDALLWSYDGTGNRLTQHDSGVLTAYVYGDKNEMTDAGSEEFTFDHFGNTASIVNIESYSYDFEGHMTQREDLSIEAIDNHEYDGNGRRMRSKLNSAANWTNFIHDELTENLICEYTLVGGTYSIKALNTYGLGLISTNRESTVRYFHFDGLGSTAHLTDTSQNVTDSYTYDAFGNPLSASGSSVNPYRYIGQWGYYDDGAMGSSSGMLLLGVRYYWAKYGRFSTWDPEPGANLYDYCLSSPGNAVDPSGRRSFCNDIGCAGSREQPPVQEANYATRSCCCQRDGRTFCCSKIYACGGAVSEVAESYRGAADALDRAHGKGVGLISGLGALIGKNFGLAGAFLGGQFGYEVGSSCLSGIDAKVAAYRAVSNLLVGCRKRNGCSCVIICDSQKGMSIRASVRCCAGYGGN